MPHDSNAPAQDPARRDAVASTNGNVTFFTTPLDAAQQAAADVQLFATALAGSQPTTQIAPLVVAGIVSAVATAVSAIATVASTAVTIAGLVKDSSGAPVQDALEIEVLNNTAQSVVPFGYNPSSCDLTEIAQPLIPTATDSFLLTSGSVKRFDSATTCTLSFYVGSSQSVIEIDLTLNYTSNEAWGLAMTIDGQPYTFTESLQLLGARFLGNTGFPSFSVYVTPVETQTGKITVAFYATEA